LLAAVPSCGGSEDTRANEVNVSRHGEVLSHHAGDNCVSCHREGGEAKGWFTLSGTVYRSDMETPYPNTTVRLFGLPSGAGETVGAVEVDANGNFFTTESFDFARGLYPGLYSDAASKQKALVTTDGACSSCHGVTVDRLFVE
jgi:mono/diheme cytochrome c family protein